MPRSSTTRVLHGLAFIVFGIVGALLVAAAERQPVFLFALVIVFTAFEIFFFGAVVILARWMLDYVAGWTIFIGNLLAAAPCSRSSSEGTARSLAASPRPGPTRTSNGGSFV